MPENTWKISSPIPFSGSIRRERHENPIKTGYYWQRRQLKPLNNSSVAKATKIDDVEKNFQNAGIDGWHITGMPDQTLNDTIYEYTRG